jgi:hypothetical protein
MKLNEEHFKRINSVLYKFIWNRNFSAAKAPERIKRNIVNKSTKLGGLGMLDIEQLDASIKLRAFFRTINSNHPFLRIVADKVDLEQFFFPSIRCDVEGVLSEGIRLLRCSRLELLRGESLHRNRKFIGLVRDIKLNRLVGEGGRMSLGYHAIRRAGKRRVGDLRNGDLRSIRNFIERDVYSTLETVLPLNGSDTRETDSLGIFCGDKFLDASKLSSKELRMYRTIDRPITTYKIGLDLNQRDCHSWLYNLNKLTSVRHKNTILKIVHGDVYTRDKLYRYGMIDNPTCSKCGGIETLIHKILECSYAMKVAKELIRITNPLRVNGIDYTRITLEDLIGVTEANYITLTLHAEVISRLLAIRDDATYLIRPSILVKQSIEQTVKAEKKLDIKNALKTLI